MVSYPRQPRLKPPAHNPSRIACQKPTGLPMITSLEPTKYSFINSLFPPKKNKIRKKKTRTSQKKSQAFWHYSKISLQKARPTFTSLFWAKKSPLHSLGGSRQSSLLGLGKTWLVAGAASVSRLQCTKLGGRADDGTQGFS